MQASLLFSLSAYSYLCNHETHLSGNRNLAGGVPVIGCRCKVCTSADRRDRRLRTAAMVETHGVRLVIDAGPDFRLPDASHGRGHIDAILLTHEHKDHIGGLDDVRAFNFVDYPPTIHKVHIYAAPQTLACVRKDFDYAFAQDKYRGVPEIRSCTGGRGAPLGRGRERSSRFRDATPERFRVTAASGRWPISRISRPSRMPRSKSSAGGRCWSTRCASPCIRRISTWKRRWR